MPRRAIDVATLEAWGEELAGIQATLTALGAPTTAERVSDLRRELPNAGEPFTEVPYA